MTGTPCIVFLIKYPEPGKVKTRLAAAIGKRKAADVYARFVEMQFCTLESLHLPIYVFYTPENRKADFQRWLGPKHTYEPQGEGDIGQRMNTAFQFAFSQGCAHVLLIGSDIPDVPRETLVEGLAALTQGNVVLAPARDGGYFCIGFPQNNFHPDIFTEIPWSTPDVYELTLTRIRKKTNHFHQLAQWFDIDTYDDLLALRKRMKKNKATKNTLYRILKEI